MMSAPAARRFRTTSASVSAMRPAYRALPRSVGAPAVSRMSFTPIGTPTSAPVEPLATSAASLPDARFLEHRRRTEEGEIVMHASTGPRIGLDRGSTVSRGVIDGRLDHRDGRAPAAVSATDRDAGDHPRIDVVDRWSGL